MPILSNIPFQVGFVITILVKNLSYLGLAHHRPKFFRLFTQPGPDLLVLVRALTGNSRPITASGEFVCERLLPPLSRHLRNGSVRVKPSLADCKEFLLWTQMPCKLFRFYCNQKAISFVFSTWRIILCLYLIQTGECYER